MGPIRLPSRKQAYAAVMGRSEQIKRIAVHEKYVEAGERLMEAKRDERLKEAVGYAMWVTCSPHEWEWTHEQQIAMAVTS